LIDLTERSSDGSFVGRAAPRSSSSKGRHRAGTSRWRRWRARLLVLVMSATAILGGSRIAELREHNARLINIGVVTLTAHPVPVETIHPSRVYMISVRAQQQVMAGQELGRVSSITTTDSGRTIQRNVILRAPIDGIVSYDPAPVGTLLQLGEAFVHLYDPDRLTLVANFPLAQLPKLTPGMTATLWGADLPYPIYAVVGRVIPRVGDASLEAQPDHLPVELLPVRRDYVSKLLPGLRFTGTVDPGTRPPGAEQSIFVQR
jgi:HlyD family secretion protein